jgi:hypothetical protein
MQGPTPNMPPHGSFSAICRGVSLTESLALGDRGNVVLTEDLGDSRSNNTVAEHSDRDNI